MTAVMAVILHRFATMILCCAGVSLPILAQDDLSYDNSPWVWNGSVSVTTSHISFSNWAAGGNYTYMLGLESRIAPQWSDSIWSFVGLWQGSFSVFKSKDQPHRKGNDDLQLHLKAGRLMIPAVHIVVFADLKSQFWPGYDDGVQQYVSNFMAPGYLTSGVGIDFRRDDLGLSLVVTPLASKETFVVDRGVDPEQYGVAAGRKVFISPGAYSRFTYAAEALPGMNVTASMILFADYSRRTRIDLSFEGRIEYAMTGFMKLYSATEVLNDDDINVNTYEDLDGDGSADDFAGSGPKVQVKAEFGLVFSISF